MQLYFAYGSNLNRDDMHCAARMPVRARGRASTAGA